MPSLTSCAIRGKAKLATVVIAIATNKNIGKAHIRNIYNRMASSSNFEVYRLGERQGSPIAREESRRVREPPAKK